MPLYTAQYRYSGDDRLDITVKGKDQEGMYFAPTWDMVNAYKNNLIDDSEYEEQYLTLINNRWLKDTKFKSVVVSLLKRIENNDITFVCFCPANTFCHRLLLAKWFQRNWTVAYKGERFKTGWVAGTNRPDVFERRFIK